MIKYNKLTDKLEVVGYGELLRDKDIIAKSIKNIYKEIGWDSEWSDRTVVAIMCLLLKELGYEEGVKIFEKKRDWKPLL